MLSGSIDLTMAYDWCIVEMYILEGEGKVRNGEKSKVLAAGGHGAGSGPCWA